ncbi:MAG TPA: N-acetyl-1-D-myo-inositol-2-amino-2-deoxy-alpha-D-glucopyranoside deacetylase [Candidatus Saccharimonadales bacterium]|nr:N-acetyl-1-D-myo-inositol-2-amino-2-deoxy-alpha-D-glucopyranoside deacetylase [Candidatus Saccharimonadales bacterium]
MAGPQLRLMAVHAHCDDETITMGGTLATYADRGVKTCVVCCTDGKLATIVDPDMPEETTRPRLAEIREAELREACRILKVDEVEFLRYGDSGMAGTPTNQLPDAFWMVPLDEATGRIVAQIRRFRPHVVVTYDGNGAYGHPDHIQAHRATLLAVEAAHLSPTYKDAGEPWRVEKLYYTAFPRKEMKRIVQMAKQAGMDPPFGEENADEMAFLTPDEYVTTTISGKAVVARKREALRAHRSQISADWPQLTLPDEIAVQFADEFFQLVISRKPAVLPETDLFAGLTPQE